MRKIEQIAIGVVDRERLARLVRDRNTPQKSAIMEYLENHNADPKPFVWTKSAGEILEKVVRAKQALVSQHQPRFYWRRIAL